ncbi:MAG TPA: hypothetical protein PKI94_03645, partial [Candidatus Gastranaerophilaceae bacterium]|nr:hypothetical protein [Candidatus Gastranaerophilaceae bacterium]
NLKMKNEQKKDFKTEGEPKEIISQNIQSNTVLKANNKQEITVEVQTQVKFNPEIKSAKKLIKKDEALNIKKETFVKTINEVAKTDKVERFINVKNESKDFTHAKVKKDSKAKLEVVVDYKTVKMEVNDGLFFVNLLKNNIAYFQAIGKEVLIEADEKEVERSIQVSATLMDALQKAVKTNKPFRIDFDKDISVILKIDKQGKISAEFIPGDKAVEEYLKLNLPMLKQSFNQQNLPYENLSYRRHNQQQQQNNNNQKNKEKDNE